MILSPILVLILIIIFMVSMVFIYLRNPRTCRIKEGFVESDVQNGTSSPRDPVNLDQPTSIRFREKNAIQSCEALRSDDPQMSKKSQDTMKLILDSHRINQWKPGVDEPLIENIRNKTGHAYCYMYNDNENKMKDLRLFGKPGCSLQNPIFKDTPFISNVYKSNYPDNTHTIPIEKCIIEIDPSETSVANLDSYWSRWGDTECGHVTDPIRATLAEKLEALEAMEKQMDEIKRLLDEYNVQIDQTDLDIRECELSKESNQKILDDLISQYNLIYESFLEVDAQRKEALEVKNEKIKEERELNELIEDKQASYLEVQKKAETCGIKLRECDRRKTDIQEQLRIQIETRTENEKTRERRQLEKEEIEQEHYDLIGPESICQSALQSGRNELEDTNDNIQRVTGLLNTCTVEREKNKNLMDVFKPRYEDMNAQANACLERERQLRIDNDKCQEQKKTCKFLTDEHKNTVQRFRDIRDRLLECEEKRRELNVIRKGLEEQNVFHFNQLDSKYGELDQFERALYKEEIQSSISNSETVINKFRSDLDKLTSAHIEQSGCSAKADFVRELNKKKNNNAEKKYRIESLKSQSCYYCDPTISHCAEKFKNDKALCSAKEMDGSLLVTSLPISTNRRCGPNFGTRCAPGQCCSIFGWCANSHDHCVRYVRDDTMYHGDGKRN